MGYREPTIQIVDMESSDVIELAGHEDQILAVAYDPRGEFLVGADSVPQLLGENFAAGHHSRDTRLPI